MAPSKNAQALPYAKDEKVLCFHGDLMYEAKIIDIRQGTSGNTKDGKDGKSGSHHHHNNNSASGEVKYLVHYKGWKSSWDDWVTADRIRKFDEENKMLAASLKTAAQSRGQGGHHYGRGGPVGGPGKKGGGPDLSSARGSEERGPGAPSFAGRGPRRGRDYELENVSCFPLYYSVLPCFPGFALCHFAFSFAVNLLCGVVQCGMLCWSRIFWVRLHRKFPSRGGSLFSTPLPDDDNNLSHIPMLLTN